jgi:hypothetical protein
LAVRNTVTAPKTASGFFGEETDAARADFLAELRGFEPLTSAVEARGDGAAAASKA